MFHVENFYHPTGGATPTAARFCPLTGPSAGVFLTGDA